MTVLSIVKDAAIILKKNEPATVLSARDTNIQQLILFLKEECNYLIKHYEWAELEKSYTVTLQANEALYPLPNDFSKWISLTGYSLADSTLMHGPLSPQEYESRVSGLFDNAVYEEWRIDGQDGPNIRIHPTPSSTGAQVKWRYQSNEYLRPTSWEEGKSFGVGDYCWYRGKKYINITGATTGSTPPTHTTGNISDGGITWRYSSAKYATITKDTDEIILDNHLIYLALKWRWRKENGENFSADYSEYKDYRSSTLNSLKGAAPVCLKGSNGRDVIRDGTVKLTGYT